MPLTLAEWLQLPTDLAEYRITDPRVIARFEKFFIRGADDECWLWQGGMINGRRSGAYGGFSADRQTQLAHRIAHRIYIGPIPVGLKVCHICDNPRCVNYVKHLFLGTDQENMLDASIKGKLHGGIRTAIFPPGWSE